MPSWEVVFVVGDCDVLAFEAVGDSAARARLIKF